MSVWYKKKVSFNEFEGFLMIKFVIFREKIQ